MDEALIELLRADLEAAGYLPGAGAALWGAPAEGARLRGVLAPARRALRRREAHEPQTPLGLLAAVFQLGEAISAAQVGAMLPALGAEGALRLGLLGRDGQGRLRAALSLNPIELPPARASSRTAAELPAEPRESWWILSDLDDHLRGGSARPDHVMGVGGATRSLLAQAGAGSAHGSALDLGTGCGIVAMHLARSGFARVVASDISERALMLARANARLNRIGDEPADGELEFRLGSLFEPLAGDRFDLILSNPPFVITPRTEGERARYEYRDGGMVGDALARSVVEGAPAHLREGGTLLCLANWETPWGGDGLERVRGWIERAAEHAGPLAAWVIERERLDPVRYAETWARDGGARPGESDFDELLHAWLDDFSERRVVAIGLGSIRVRRLAGDEDAAGGATIRVEHAAEPFAEHAGPALDSAFAAGVRTQHLSDDEILEHRWLRADGVREQREHTPGAEAPRAIALTTDGPIARTVHADPLLAAAVGACDGELTLRQIADALAVLLEVDAEQAAAALVEGVRELVWLGMLAAAHE